MRLKYRKRLSQILRQLPESETKTWVSEHRFELREYSSLHWYFLEQLYLFSYFHRKLPKLSTHSESFHQVDDEVFERWNKSEFADHFLKALNQGKHVQRATKDSLAIMDHHLATWARRQIQKSDALSRHYRFQSSLGEFEKKGKVGRLLSTTLHLTGKDLELRTHTLKEMKNFSERIEAALKVIQRFSPDSWERFKAFTDVIIPIKQKQFVSFSHQDLPGYSMINLYDRDFVDLVDDLLHENGHHHLNYFLNLGKLIEEPEDFIYYSPWRRTARPLRGLYHAYFTFFWAFKLFSDLARAKEMDSIWYLFSKTEKEKIYWRAVEEFHMLEYAYEELGWARRHGLIKKTGWDLIQAQRQILKRHKSHVGLWERKLKHNRAELKELKAVLSQARKDYKKP